MQIEMWRVLKILEIYSKFRDLSIPAKTAYKFSRLCDGLRSASVFYEEEMRKVISQYGAKNEDGSLKTTKDGGIQIEPELIKSVQEKFNELSYCEVYAPEIQFSIDELDGLGLSIGDFDIFLPFITE